MSISRSEDLSPEIVAVLDGHDWGHSACSGRAPSPRRSTILCWRLAVCGRLAQRGRVRWLERDQLMNLVDKLLLDDDLTYVEV
jgi:hypothetical protein